MGIISTIINTIKENSQKNKIENENAARRGITEYAPSQIGGFVEEDIYQTNVICSGDGEDLRSEMLVSLCAMATSAKKPVPVIILHKGDTALTEKFRIVYGSNPSYIEIPGNGRYFDPLYALKPDDLSQLIVETAPAKYGITYNGGAYLDTLTGYLTGRRRLVTLDGLQSCPHTAMPQLINNAAIKGTLSPSLIQKLQISLAQGQVENHKIKAYLQQLYKESKILMPPDKAGYNNCVSLFNAIQQKSVLCIDIRSDRNNLLLRLIAEQIQMLIRNGNSFYLILDNINLRSDNSMKDLCTSKAKGFSCAIAGDDVFSLCEGDEKLFSTILGNSSKWFLFHHTSGLSAKQWSSAFSKYQKIDTTLTHTKGKGKATNYGFGGHTIFGINWSNQKNETDGYSITNKDEAVIRSEEIQKLPIRSGYIYTANTRELAHVGRFLPQ